MSGETVHLRNGSICSTQQTEIMRVSNDILFDVLLYLRRDSLDVTCIVSRKLRRVTECLTTSAKTPLRRIRVGRRTRYAESVSGSNTLKLLHILVSPLDECER